MKEAHIMSTLIHSTINLLPGDVLPRLGKRVVLNIERDSNNLGATLIRFEDGSFFHAGTFDVHTVERAEPRVTFTAEGVAPVALTPTELLGLGYSDSAPSVTLFGIGYTREESSESESPIDAHLVIRRTDGERVTFAEWHNLLDNLIGAYGFYLEGEVVEESSPSIIAQIWVCTDCMLSRENDELTRVPATCEPWSLIPTADVTANWDSETEEGVSDFGQSPCKACGSHLYGYRYRYAVWAWERN